MNGRTRGWSIAATMIAIVALVAAVSAWVRPAVYGGVGAQLAGGPTNFSGVHVAVPTAQATATPGVLINSAAAANPFEVQIASTPMVAVEDNGELALSGALDLAALLYPSFVNLAVTDGYTLTAAYTVYSLDTTGAVTITLAADADEGQPETAQDHIGQ